MSKSIGFNLVLLTVLFTSHLLAAQSTTQSTPATKRSHNFDRWENEIAAYEKADQANPPAKGGIVFIGSSTIRGWKTLAKDFPGQNVLNRGFGGSQIVDATHFADRIIFPYEPKAVFLRAGGNDIHVGKSAEQVFEEYKQFVQTVHARLPDTKIFFISLCPTIARLDEADANKELNGLIEAFARDNAKLGYIETYDMVLDEKGEVRAELFVADKLHFNADGYKLLAERVKPFVKD